MSWDVDSYWEASAAAAWERLNAGIDEYEDAVEATAEDLKEEIKRYSYISGCLDDGFELDTGEDLTEEQTAAYKAELESLDDYIDSECRYSNVKRADVEEAVRW